MHTICFWKADRLTHQLFNIVGIMLVGASAGATEGIIKFSIMLHTGKASRTASERTVPHCGPKPQLKDGVEHDCCIYAWNSACTMEGIDIVMVRNTLLLVGLGFDTAGYLQTGAPGRTDRGWNW